MISMDTQNNDTNDSLEPPHARLESSEQSEMLKYKLYGKNGPSKNISIDIAGPSLAIGRAGACDIVLRSTHVDPIAVRVILDQDTVCIISESFEPILINGSVIRRGEKTPIEVGDFIQIDVFKLYLGLIEVQNEQPAPDPEDTLDRITALNNKESGPKVWVTKPTSPGNREHDVPERPPTISGSTIATAIAALVLIAGLAAIALTA